MSPRRRCDDTGFAKIRKELVIPVLSTVAGVATMWAVMDSKLDNVIENHDLTRAQLQVVQESVSKVREQCAANEATIDAYHGG